MTKKDGFYEIPINCEQEIISHQQEKWIYRGQRNVEWPLQTSLERACENYGRDITEAKKIEDILLREFQRKYHHYSVHIPNDTLEWFSVMQHYGAPTRLLDFTYSIYVAAYFASEQAEKKDTKEEHTKMDCAVWAINGEWAKEKSKTLFKEGSKGWKYINEDITRENAMDFDPTFRKKPKKFVCPLNPFELNERLTIQKGVFMCPGDVRKSFECNLRDFSGWDEKGNIKKIIIPNRLRRKVLHFLSDMNISRATLFPGLEGFAQSLKVSLPPRWDYVSNSRGTTLN